MFSSSSRTKPGRLRVIHLVKDYLPYSCPWIHRQVVGAPEVESGVLALRVLDGAGRRSPVNSLRSIKDESFFWYAVARSAAWRGKRWGNRAVVRLLSSWLPDLAHGHFGHHSWFFLPAVRSLGIPLVVSFYGHDMSELPRRNRVWLERYQEMFDYGTLFFCEGPVMAEALAAIGCPHEKIRIQRLGIDPAAVNTRIRELRPGEILQVLAVARFTEKKGLPDAIRAVALAREKAKVNLTIVGDAAPGANGREEKRRIGEALSTSGMGESVRFLGQVDHQSIFRLADDYHVLIQPSKTSAKGDTEGGAPVTLIELGATGLPAVATRHADIPGIVINGVTGLLAREGSVGELAGALIRLASEPGLLARLSMGMTAHIRREFDQKLWDVRLGQHYQEALSAREETGAIGPIGPIGRIGRIGRIG